jgi:7-carboxy-7-deazaguanine synthase
VRSFTPNNVVVTGGEPLIQRASLLPLVTLLHETGYRIEVETNGTIAPGPLAGLVDQWNVSPKLRSAGNEGLVTVREDVLRDFAAEPNAWFKFVICEPDDVAHALDIADRAGIARERVILMPEGTTAEALMARGRWLADLCVTTGTRFSTRLHVLLWGDTRGV